MCGIAGGEKVEALVRHLSHRGQSSCTEKELELGHVLHSVVGEVEQPLEGEGVLTANCEIYNWKELAAKYDLEPENDAELLHKLLDMKGMSVLEELDGVYAFAYKLKMKL